MSRIVDPLGRASHGCDVVALHDGDLWLIEAKDYSHPGRLFRGGFEDVEREGRGGGLLGRVLLVRRVVAKASKCVSPLRLDGASRMVGRRLACRDAPRLASTSLNPRDHHLTRKHIRTYCAKVV